MQDRFTASRSRAGQMCSCTTVLPLAQIHMVRVCKYFLSHGRLTKRTTFPARLRESHTALSCASPASCNAHLIGHKPGNPSCVIPRIAISPASHHVYLSNIAGAKMKAVEQ